MGRVRSEALCGLRGCVVGITAVLGTLISTSHSADARHHRYYARTSQAVPAYSPLFASIVVDGNSGEILYAANADSSRHPASLTKIMTLYLLFERLDAGTIRLDTRLKVSEHAAEQAPTKLGLKPGQTIAVEDAIKAVVTKSANDAAVAIAENLAGDEEEFAKLMTQKAHAIGMSRTTYVNASGLPDDDQVTSARDQALLGRAIQERFPRYYRYFSTQLFVYRGSAMRNHNHLLGAVGGVDGIKTGYTRASGFNLVTSVHRDGRYLIAVVLGGRSAGERDARVRELISTHIREAALRRTVPALAEKALVVAEKTQPSADPPPTVSAKAPAPLAHADPTTTANVGAPMAAGSNDPIQPLLVRTIPYRTSTPQPATLGPMPPLEQVASTTPPPPAPATVVPARPTEAADTVVVSSDAAPAVSTVNSKLEPGKPVLSEPPPHARGGWVIQVGAFEDVDDAKQHLSAAQTKAPAMLSAADPFTERVRKGAKTYYRARFAGLDRAAAEATCKLLKRSDMECMAMKN